MSPAALRAMREQEQRDAAIVLGVTEVRFLHVPDGGLRHTSELECRPARAALAALIAVDRAGWRVPHRPRERLRPGATPEATPDETGPAKLAEAIPRSAF